MLTVKITGSAGAFYTFIVIIINAYQESSRCCDPLRSKKLTARSKAPFFTSKVEFSLSLCIIQLNSWKQIPFKMFQFGRKDNLWDIYKRFAYEVRR